VIDAVFGIEFAGKCKGDFYQILSFVENKTNLLSLNNLTSRPG
jgi:NAD(P)H-hydrate repair Nnr-like enzyme with NAD(P)H-hydrate epimerase domain